MAASPILTLLYQVPLTEYTQKWNKQKPDVQRQLMARISVPDIGGMSGTQAFPSRTFVLLTVSLNTKWQHFSAMIPVKRKGCLFFKGPFLLEKRASQWLSLLNLPGQKQVARSYPHSKKLSKAIMCIFSLYPWRSSPPARKNYQYVRATVWCPISATEGS